MRATSLTLVALATLALPLTGQTRPAPDSLTSGLEGEVRGIFEGVARPLPFAIVEAVGRGFGRSAVADSLGRYHLPDLRSGEVRVRATHAGHEAVALTVVLTPGRSTRVDLELAAAPVELPRVDVTGDPELDDPSPRDRDPTPRPEVELQALDLTPGVGQPGLLDAVGSLPGNDPANATDVLYMRGSTTDLKLVLLDGVPVFTPFHVAGLLRSFEPSVLGGAELHVGGAPARYDGGLTHILDLSTRRARRDRLRGSGSIDLLSASVAGEAPLGRSAGVMVSARSLHDLGRAPLGGPRPYGYRDALVTFDADVGEGHGFRATGFWNAESVRLDWDRIPGDAAWSNRAGSLRYRGQLGGTRLELTAGASGYRADLPLQPSGEENEPPPPAILAAAAVDRVRLVAEAVRGPAEAPVRAGLTLDHIDALFDATRGSQTSLSRDASTSPGAFLDVTRPLGPGVTLRAGLRADLFDLETARLAPRAALHWEIDDGALLTVAAGRYHQPTRTADFEIERTLAQSPVAAAQPARLLPVAVADHVVLSLEQMLADRVHLGLEGFWKRFDGLRASQEETVRSSGLDVRLVSTGEAGVAWLGYGLSWFWSTVDLSGRASDFAGRHLLSAGLSGRLFGPVRGEGRIAYGAGLPYTAIPFRSSSDALAPESPAQDDAGLETLSALSRTTAPILGGLDEEFLRLDLELHALLEPEWGGRRWQVRPYVRILNALDRRDALFYTYRTWRPDEVTPLAERPLLPLVGVAFSF